MQPFADQRSVRPGLTRGAWPVCCPWKGVFVLLGVLVPLLCFGAFGGAQSIRFGGSRIVVTASPTRLPADGEATARVRVEVRARDGSAVPDGTEVIVSTDLGDLSADGGSKQRSLATPTEGGYAQVFLTSEEPGSATVRATYLDSRNLVLVEFTPPGEGGRPESRVVHVSGGWVGYCSDLDLIEARGPAELRYQGLVLEADTLQLNPRTLVVRADGVRMKRRDQQLECEDTYLELSAMRGGLRRFGDLGVEEVTYNAYTLQPTEAEQEIPEDAYRFDDREGRIWTVARSLSLFPGEKLVLRSASLHVDQRRVMRYPPYWVIAFEGYSGSSNSQFVQFDSNGGLALDFPLFFSVTDTSTGALKIQRGASNGSFMARNGWSLALEFTNQSLSGDRDTALVIDGLPKSDFGLLFSDRRKLFGDGDADLSIAWPDHHSLFSDFSFFRYGSAGHLAVRTHLDRPEDLGLAYGLDTDYLSNSKPLLGGTRFRWGTGLGVERSVWNADGLVFEHSVATYLDFNGWRPSESTSIVPSVSNSFTWNTADRLDNVARLQLSFSQRFFRGVNANLRYSFEHRSGRSGLTYLPDTRGIDQQVNLNLSAAGSSKWDAYLNANYGLTDQTVYGFGALNYRPWRWYRLGLLGTYYKFSDLSFSDVEISLNRALGNREIGLRYSTADDRVSLQFGAGQF